MSDDTDTGEGGGALVKRDDGEMTTRDKIIFELLHYFVDKYGMQLSDAILQPLGTGKLIELARQGKLPGWVQPPKQLPAPSSSGSGCGILLLVLAGLAFSNKARRRR